MALTLFDIILDPVMTEKSSMLVDKHKKITLRVHPAANKVQIAEALEKLFNVRVKDVNIVVRQGKLRRFKRMASQGKLTKRAIITLKDEESFAILTQAGAGSAMPGQVSSSASETTE
jgi:large subunit ribosomal protein L23